MSSTTEYRSRPEVRARARETDRKYREANRAEINARVRAREAKKKVLGPAGERVGPTTPKSDAEERAAIRAYRLAKKYGLTPEQWGDMFELQGRCCAICRTTEPGGRHRWQTDHCHSTGKVRGILCTSCNVVLGSLKEDVSIMQNMIEYVRTHNV